MGAKGDLSPSPAESPNARLDGPVAASESCPSEVRISAWPPKPWLASLPRPRALPHNPQPCKTESARALSATRSATGAGSNFSSLQQDRPHFPRSLDRLNLISVPHAKLHCASVDTPSRGAADDRLGLAAMRLGNLQLHQPCSPACPRISVTDWFRLTVGCLEAPCIPPNGYSGYLGNKIWSGP